MTRTQIQLPDDVFAKAKKLCEAREISLAELARRGIEYILTLWQKARAQDFAFRRVYDTRSALTMTAQGVTDFATVNVKDFERLGFRRVWNPLTEHWTPINEPK